MICCEDFYNQPACCTDVLCCAPIQQSLQKPDDLLLHEGLLDELLDSGCGTNMSLESLLCKIKSAAPRLRRHPTAERVVHAGMIAQHMSRYLAHGFDDNRA